MNSNVPDPAHPSDDGPPPEDTQRRLLGVAIRHSSLNLSEVWLYYFSIGGSAGEYEIDAYLNASYSLPAMQRDLLAHAVNELIDLIPQPPRAPYSSDLPGDDQAADFREKENSDQRDDDANR